MTNSKKRQLPAHQKKRAAERSNYGSLPRVGFLFFLFVLGYLFVSRCSSFFTIFSKFSDQLNLRGATVSPDSVGRELLSGSSGAAITTSSLHATSAQGLEFQVNNYTIDHQAAPSVSGLSDGGFVIVWESLNQDNSGRGVFGTLYNENGTITSLFDSRINTFVADDQQDPSVAALMGDGFAVVWESSGQDGSSYGVYGQCFNGNGINITEEFRVNSHTGHFQWNPSIATLSSGDFIVTWASNDNQDGSSWGVFGQRYSQSCLTIGAEFLVNTYTTEFQRAPSVAALSGGGFVVVWESFNQDNSSYGIYGQRYNTNSSVSGTEFRVNTHTINSQWLPSVSGLGNGGFAVVWSSDGQDGSEFGIYGKCYAANGANSTSEFRVNTYTLQAQLHASIARLQNNDFIVVWQSFLQDDSGYGIYAQRYDIDCLKKGLEFRVNSYTSDHQSAPSISALADGGFVIVWESENQDSNQGGSGYDIYGQRYDKDGYAVTLELMYPSSLPSSQPSLQPSTVPSSQPSSYPSRQPSSQPVAVPTIMPSSQPSVQPSSLPTQQPSSQPIALPTNQPSGQPSIQPIAVPTVIPTSQPSRQPSTQPSSQPSSRSTGMPTGQPSQQPNALPSTQPSSQPSQQPVAVPTKIPSGQPSVQPSSLPSTQPSSQPIALPTNQPSGQPSIQPIAVPTVIPTSQPSRQPSTQPSSQPSSRSTGMPTGQPSQQPNALPSTQPSSQPSQQPVAVPTKIPSGQPSVQPSSLPSTQPSSQPVAFPTNQPSGQPSIQPIAVPTVIPTGQPSRQPSTQPSSQPSSRSTGMPTGQPSQQPNALPSTQPSSQPSRQPVAVPTVVPSGQPLVQPSSLPSSQPSSQPIGLPTNQPSGQPSIQPIAAPTVIPSGQPSRQPSTQPSSQPSSRSTGMPTGQPSQQPNTVPSTQPSSQPSKQPVAVPTKIPSGQPSGQPSSLPSTQPSSQPVAFPTNQPSGQPSTQPIAVPTVIPSGQPSRQPSVQPSSLPSTQPSSQPVAFPTNQPSGQPSTQPIAVPTVIPTSQPSRQPSTQPSSQPSSRSTGTPSVQPSQQPNALPSTQPSSQPSRQPVAVPTVMPSGQPSVQPSSLPSTQPSSQPVAFPTNQPSGQPSTQPIAVPTVIPTGQPSRQPSAQPSSQPSGRSTGMPTGQPSQQLNALPSTQPSSQPSKQPVAVPTKIPSGQPSIQPSSLPSTQPSSQPVAFPTNQPSGQPSIQPIAVPTVIPTGQPSRQPSTQPSSQPSSRSTGMPTGQPSQQPNALPSTQPSGQPSKQPVALPTAMPSGQPSVQPSSLPSSQPSSTPLGVPTGQPSSQPIAVPTVLPSGRPSSQPSSFPSFQPQALPTSVPSSLPLAKPTASPVTSSPTMPGATHSPSYFPTSVPSARPSSWPTLMPTLGLDIYLLWESSQLQIKQVIPLPFAQRIAMIGQFYNQSTQASNPVIAWWSGNASIHHPKTLWQPNWLAVLPQINNINCDNYCESLSLGILPEDNHLLWMLQVGQSSYSMVIDPDDDNPIVEYAHRLVVGSSSGLNLLYTNTIYSNQQAFQGQAFSFGYVSNTEIIFLPINSIGSYASSYKYRLNNWRTGQRYNNLLPRHGMSFSNDALVLGRCDSGSFFGVSSGSVSHLNFGHVTSQRGDTIELLSVAPYSGRKAILVGEILSQKMYQEALIVDIHYSVTSRNPLTINWQQAYQIINRTTVFQKAVVLDSQTVVILIKDIGLMAFDIPSKSVLFAKEWLSNSGSVLFHDLTLASPGTSEVIVNGIVNNTLAFVVTMNGLTGDVTGPLPTTIDAYSIDSSHILLNQHGVPDVFSENLGFSSSASFLDQSEVIALPSMNLLNEPISFGNQPDSRAPSSMPTKHIFPTSQPSSLPSGQPSSSPNSVPTGMPVSSKPTQPGDTNPPTSSPTTSKPTSQPSGGPSAVPTKMPSRKPSSQPSSQPSAAPTTKKPSSSPSSAPLAVPTRIPSGVPSTQPSSQPSSRPSPIPSVSAAPSRNSSSTNNNGNSNTQSDEAIILSTGAIIFLVVAVSTSSCCLFVCLFNSYYKDQKARAFGRFKPADFKDLKSVLIERQMSISGPRLSSDFIERLVAFEVDNKESINYFATQLLTRKEIMSLDNYLLVRYRADLAELLVYPNTADLFLWKKILEKSVSKKIAPVPKVLMPYNNDAEDKAVAATGSNKVNPQPRPRLESQDSTDRITSSPKVNSGSLQSIIEEESSLGSAVDSSQVSMLSEQSVGKLNENLLENTEGTEPVVTVFEYLPKRIADDSSELASSISANSSIENYPGARYKLQRSFSGEGSLASYAVDSLLRHYYPDLESESQSDQGEINHPDQIEYAHSIVSQESSIVASRQESDSSSDEYEQDQSVVISEENHLAEADDNLSAMTIDSKCLNDDLACMDFDSDTDPNPNDNDEVEQVQVRVPSPVMGQDSTNKTFENNTSSLFKLTKREVSISNKVSPHPHNNT